MTNNHTRVAGLKLFDVVALLKNIPGEKLIKGQVGTIVEELDEETYLLINKEKQLLAWH